MKTFLESSSFLTKILHKEQAFSHLAAIRKCSSRKILLIPLRCLTPPPWAGSVPCLLALEAGARLGGRAGEGGMQSSEITAAAATPAVRAKHASQKICSVFCEVTW